MTPFITALTPVIVIVALGRLIAARGWLPADAFRGLERLSFLVLLPAMIIRALANAPIASELWQMAAALVLAQIILGALGLAARAWPHIQRPAIGTIIQSNVRWNTIIALALGSAVYGEGGLALVGLAAAVMIPAANVLSVYGLVAYAERPPGMPPRPLRALVRNPLVIASLVGIGIALLGVELPAAADSTLAILGQAAIAAGLLSAGAGIDFSALRGAGALTLTWSLVRLLVLPALVLGIGLAIGLNGLPLAIALICAATPTAPNSFVLARELGGDAALAANLIALQTLLALITLPLTWLVITTLVAI